MFGSTVRPPRPLLLIVVYGAFLAIVGISAAAQSLLVGAHFSASTLTSLVGSDAATTRAFVNAYIRPSDLSGEGSGPADRDLLEQRLAALTRPGEILRLELRRPDGTILASSEARLRGVLVPASPEFQKAIGGTAQAAIGPADASGAGPGVFASPTLLREFLPISVDGKVLGVVGIWRDAVPILARLDDLRAQILTVTLSAALIAAILLFGVFRTAQARLSRQTTALLEAARMDPLTGLLNHGSLVGLLAMHVEAARTDGRPLGVALVDIDNFRLLNDNHGHEAGDAALVSVAWSLEDDLRKGLVVGRYGPDEFLLIAEPSAVAELEPTVHRLRNALVDRSLQFAETERLPITVSAGIATYPDHAASATALLAVATSVLEEAKASGGDSVRQARDPEVTEEVAEHGFDVLQGLIIAVDTKDRYTKHHCEDVARYATFIGERIGFSSDELRTVGIAGLLHDVGKIGIPDHILRKPGKLSEGEYAIVQQHVALGDMIVRDLPDLDVVRAGIRHHHERWDGNGYLDRLEGEEIPEIARVLAVADAFSAMTTTRPYRKALSVREALDRLGEAAGTQLEERLVSVFIDGLEHDADPPLPGAPVRIESLWVPGRRVA